MVSSCVVLEHFHRPVWNSSLTGFSATNPVQMMCVASLLSVSFDLSLPENTKDRTSHEHKPDRHQFKARLTAVTGQLTKIDCPQFVVVLRQGFTNTPDSSFEQPLVTGLDFIRHLECCLFRFDKLVHQGTK